MTRIRSRGVRIILGAALSAGVAAGTEALSRWVVAIPNPDVFFLLSVAFAGFLWGMAAAMAAVAVVCLACLYVFAEPGQWWVYTPTNVVRILVLCAAAPCTALLVGQLKQRSDRSLVSMESRYRALMESTPDAVIVQENETIIYANQAAYELFGFKFPAPRDASAKPPADLVGSSIWDRLHSDSHQLVRARIEQLSAGREALPPVEESWVRVDGSTFVAEVAARRVLIERRPASLVLLHDLTRRRQMEQRIHDQVRDLSLLQEVSRAFLFGLKASEVPEYLCAIVAERTGVNQAWVAMVGSNGELTPASCMNDAPDQMMTTRPPAASPAAEDLIRRSILVAKPIVIQDVIADPAMAGWHALARELGYRAAAAFPLISGEQIVAVLSVYHAEAGGLTESRVLLIQSLVNLAAIALGEAQAHELMSRRAQSLEVAVAERTAEVRAAAAEMQAFTYSVSHDLRAPLRAIGGFSEIVLRRHAQEMPEGARRYLENIVSASAHMAKLIDDLLSYARLGRRGIEIQRVDLNRLVQHIMTDLDGRIREKSASVTIPPDLPSLETDATLLRQVLTNLLDNALTYHAPGQPPRVELHCELHSSRLKLRVIDHGIGIDAEHVDSIFNIFQRLHSSDDFPGTGIGLAIVRKSVALLNGTVAVESAPGKGSTFTVALPLAGEMENAA